VNGAAQQKSEATQSQPPQQPQPANPTGQAPAGEHPTFDCARAHSRGEMFICSNAGLAALDRNMAVQYASAMSTASPQQKDLLKRTRDRFMAYRDRCPNRSCIGDAYVGRMREIRDIMEGRWQRPR
jgi:uncharacterized protein